MRTWKHLPRVCRRLAPVVQIIIRQTMNWEVTSDVIEERVSAMRSKTAKLLFYMILLHFLKLSLNTHHLPLLLNNLRLTICSKTTSPHHCCRIPNHWTYLALICRSF